MGFPVKASCSMISEINPMKILMAQLNPIIGDLAGNQQKLLHAISHAKKNQCDLLVSSEMALTGYPPEDFLLLSHFIDAAEAALKPIIAASDGLGVIMGTIRRSQKSSEKLLYNTAAICSNGKLLGFQDKTLLPTYDVFDERRYFSPAEMNKAWEINSFRIGITICEDLWQHSHAVKDVSYIKDPVDDLKTDRLDVMVNLSASPFHLGKLPTRFHVCKQAAHTLQCPVVLCNQVGGNDSLIFDGHSLCMNSQGTLVALAKGFQEDLFILSTTNNSSVDYRENLMQDLHDALVLGLRDYFGKLGFKKACIGLSGGIDSALVACLAVEALGADNVYAIAMPSRYSSKESVKDAEDLANHLSIPLHVISIETPFQAYLDILSPYFEGKPADATEENLQARIRGMILMAFSNKFGMLVLSTGNKSELAMGYSTLYGDMCGGLAVISDLTKEQVYELSHWINARKKLIPENTMRKPPSAELRPNQKDTDSLPEYPIVDAILQDYIVHGMRPEAIARAQQLPLALVNGLVCKIHANEYKRRQSPPGLRVTEKAFSIGRRFPIVQKWA